MKNVQEMRIVKTGSQSASELLALVVYAAIMYYSLRPDDKDKHLAYIKGKVAAVKTWVAIQDTIQEIRDLPETPS